MEKEEKKVVTEKGTLLSAGIILITSGVAMIGEGKVTVGFVSIIVGLLILYLREHFKFGRWHKANAYWKGKPCGK